MSLAEEELFDVSLDKLVFESVSRGKHGLSTGVGDLMEDGKVEESTMGVTGITLQLSDPGYAALNSGLFETRVRCTIDGVNFRMTRFSILDDDQLETLFEHELIAAMREHDSPLAAPRTGMTRAEFILKMLRELKLPYNFICPELHKKQPEQAATQKEAAAETKAKHGEEVKSLKEAERAPTVSAHDTGLSDVQSREAAALLRGCQAESASDLVMVACICAGLGESTLGADPETWRPNSNGYWGVLQFGSGRNGSEDSGLDVHDTEGAARWFCKGGKGFQAGGANHLAASVSDPGEIATKVEASGKPGAFYGKFQAQAKKVVEAFKGGALSSFNTSPQGEETKTTQYMFTRGQGEDREDTFSCATRLAKEVNWRFFVCGPRNIYYVNDDDLIKAAPRYVIEPGAEGVVKFTADVEVGHRTVKMRGRRMPKPSQGILTAHVTRWGAPPGTVIEAKGYGPADGPWLVDSIERPIFDDEGTVHVRAPQKALPEPHFSPQAETPETPEPPGSGSVAGYTNPFAKLTGYQSRRIDQGVDIGGVGPVLALGDGTIELVTTGDSRWEGGAFISLKLETGAYAGKSIFYAEAIEPAVHKGDKVKAGQTIGTSTAGGEFGWAEGGSSNLPLAEHLPGQGNGTTESSAAGASYDRLLKSLGCPGGTMQAGGPKGQMPSGYP